MDTSSSCDVSFHEDLGETSFEIEGLYDSEEDIDPFDRAISQLKAPPVVVTGREDERKAIVTFVREKVKHSQGGSYYITGVPGTGKTATMTWAMNEISSMVRIFVPIFVLLC